MAAYLSQHSTAKKPSPELFKIQAEELSIAAHDVHFSQILTGENVLSEVQA